MVTISRFNTVFQINTRNNNRNDYSVKYKYLYAYITPIFYYNLEIFAEAECAYLSAFFEGEVF